ncbi:MAG: hypothetical protein M0Z50_09025 [Planctomycetia bacterium]|nr:hypothetical protein [Planctomycetia bacterium]
MFFTHRTCRLSLGVWAVLVSMGMFTLAGCQGPVVPNQNTVNPFPQVHLTSYGLQGKILVNEPIVSRVGDGQLDVVIPVRNVTGDELYLAFQYSFLNAQGAQVEETSGWNTLRIPAYSMAQIHFTSLTAAANFDCDIRRLP